MSTSPLVKVRITALERLGADVARLFLQLPANSGFSYRAGQYLDILHEGAGRSFSIACAPRSDGLLELHIRRIPGNPFTDFVFETLTVGAELTIAGPFGRFALQPPGPRHRLFLAGGTGFAPIKSFIETHLRQCPAATASLYWGARSSRDLYLHAQACQWQREQGLRYVPVLSEEEAGWRGRSGLVHEALLADWPELSGCEVYASGPPAMIEAARQACLAQGLAAEHFYREIY